MRRAFEFLVGIIVILLICSCAASVVAAAPKPTCADIENYREDFAEVILSNDAGMEAIALMAELDEDDFMALSDDEYETLGEGFRSIAEDMEDMKVKPSMKQYHEAMTASMGLLGKVFLVAADSGFLVAAMMLSDEMDETTDDLDSAEKALTRACPTWDDDDDNPIA